MLDGVTSRPIDPAVDPRPGHHRPAARRRRDAFAGSVALARRAEDAGLPAGLVRRAPQHGVDRLVGDQRADRPRRRPHEHDPARRRRRHAAQPLAADHRRAVRHARRRCTPAGSTSASAGRPAPTRTRCGPCAATRARPRRSPRTCWSCRATSAGETPRPRRRRDPGQGHRRAAVHPRLVAVRRQLAAALGLPYAFASHFAPAGPRRRRSPSTAATFQPSAQLDEPYVIAGVNVIAADTDDEAAGAAPDRAARAGRAASSARGQRPHRRRGRRAPGARRRAAHVAQMMRYTARRHARRGRGVPRRVRRARRRRRADHRPLVAHASTPACAPSTSSPTCTSARGSERDGPSERSRTRRCESEGGDGREDSEPEHGVPVAGGTGGELGDPVDRDRQLRATHAVGEMEVDLRPDDDDLLGRERWTRRTWSPPRSPGPAGR